MILIYVLNILLIAFLINALYVRERFQPLHNFFYMALLIKLLAGIALGLIYKYYYLNKGDTFLYFQDAITLSKIFIKKPVEYFQIIFNHQFTNNLVSDFSFTNQPRAFFMVKILSPFAIITHNNYWLSSLYLSFFSFLGCWKLANLLAYKFPAYEIGAAIAFLFLPSFVFWSSGIIKESILIGCLCLSISFLFQNSFNGFKGLIKIFFIAFSIFIIFQIKYYYLAIILPILIAYYITDIFFKNKKYQFQIIAFLILFISTFILSTFIHPNLNYNIFISALVKNHDINIRGGKNALHIYFDNLQPTPISLVKNIPIAFVSGLYRNFVWEAKSGFQYLIGFENLLLLLLSFYTIFQLINKKINIQFPLLLTATLVFIILLAVLLSLSSPNFGSLSRYKSGYIPFFFYILSFSVFKNKMKSGDINNLS